MGCGALGNEVLKGLALAGAEHLTVVDFDVVEPSNLNRSVLFRLQDAADSRPKVEAVSERLRELNPGMEITAICGDAAFDVGLGIFRESDVVIGCVDSRQARYSINRLCMRAGVSWVDGGIHGLEGTARVFAPQRNCYACNLGPEGLRELARRAPCSGCIRRSEAAGHVPTTGVAASVVGAVQVQEAFKLLEGESEDCTSLLGRIFYYDGAHMTARTADFRAWDEDCPVHELWGPVEKAPLGVCSTAGEVLDYLRSRLSESNVSFFLHDDCFVDRVEPKSGGREKEVVEVMLPGRKVASFVEAHPYLGGFPLSDLWQNEYCSVDAAFPYPALTLRELGIPRRDVLKVRAGSDTYYFEID